jgi:hypothetical protein
MALSIAWSLRAPAVPTKARFAKHRESFERIAIDKFIRHALEDDGSIAVLAGDVQV